MFLTVIVGLLVTALVIEAINLSPDGEIYLYFPMNLSLEDDITF
jgi:hypothetical protein